MKVIVFNGSPRAINSNSHQIVKEILKGAEEAGSFTKEIFLIEKNIEYCRGCFSCWSNSSGSCIIKDDMKELIDLYLQADYIGLATPVYGMLMTAVLKNFTDRLLPLMTPHIKRNSDGSFYHQGRVKSFPKMFFVANAGFPGENNFDLLKKLMSYQPQKNIFEIYRNCGEILSEKELGPYQTNVDRFFKALRNAGREMVNTGEVSEATIKEIHIQLISDEEYMQQANEFWDQEIDKNKE